MSVKSALHKKGESTDTYVDALSSNARNAFAVSVSDDPAKVGIERLHEGATGCEGSQRDIAGLLNARREKRAHVGFSEGERGHDVGEQV